jgi:Ca2+-binding EF-hand superfamily protein
MFCDGQENITEKSLKTIADALSVEIPEHSITLLFKHYDTERRGYLRLEDIQQIFSPDDEH